MATPLGNSVPRTGNALIDGITQGSKWNNGSLTYSLWNTDYGVWNQYSKEVVAYALSQIEAVANVKFTYIETGGAPSFSTDLEFIFTGNELYKNYPLRPLAIGVFPDTNYGNYLLAYDGSTRSDFPNVEGAILLDNYQTYFDYSNPGGTGFWALIHEIGHTLGLKHPQDDGGNGRPTFAELGISALENQLYTIMSYNQVYGASLSSYNPATPMMLDILALQSIYGANMSYQSGNNYYLLADDGVVQTLWDSGGVDTIDASQISLGTYANMNPGTVSVIGTTYGAIAFNTYIENYTGSTSSDTIIGNVLGNVIYGNSGSDYVQGGEGNDLLFGGIAVTDSTDVNDTIFGDGGRDTIYGNAGGDVIYGGSDYLGAFDDVCIVYGGKGSDTIYGGSGNDWIAGGGGAYDPFDVGDLMYGSGGSDLLSGNGGNDTIYGDSTTAAATDGNDIIWAGRGNDQVYGNGGNDEIRGNQGNDTLDGGGGRDTFYFENASEIDIITYFEGAGSALGDIIAVVANANNNGITSALALAAAVSYSTGAAILDLSFGNTVTIYGVTSGSLTADDFIIV